MKPTIVGAQASGGERMIPNVPVGVERLLTAAAVDEEFAQRLLDRREEALAEAGVSLTPTEKSILRSAGREMLRAMVEQVRSCIPRERRRAFLKQSTAAFFGLLAAGVWKGCSLGPGIVCTGARVDHDPDYYRERNIDGEAPDDPLNSGNANPPSDSGTNPPSDSGTNPPSDSGTDIPPEIEGGSEAGDGEESPKEE